MTEVPVFALNNKAVRARHVDANDRAALERAYTRRLVRPVHLAEGQVVQRTISVIANPAFGFPSDLGQRLFHLLVARWDTQRTPEDPRVYIDRREICRGLGLVPSGRIYHLIELQLRAMKALVIECSDAWYERPGPGRQGAYAPGRKTVSMIADWCFQAEALAGGRVEAIAQSALPRAAWIKLGEAIHASLRGRYLLPLDWDYFLALDPVARRLYAYLSKRAGTDHCSYGERLKLIAERLPLDGDRPSQVLRALAKAMQRLTQPIELAGRSVRFLDSYAWPPAGDGWEQVIKVWFHGRSRVAELRARLAHGGTVRSSDLMASG